MNVVIFNILASLWFHLIAFHSLVSIKKTNDNSMKSILVTHTITSMITGFISITSILKINVYHINGRDVHLLRYIEWLFCAPLLTSQICQAGNFVYIDTIIVVTLTVAFCLCGVIAAITNIFWAKVVLGVQGTVYSLIVVRNLLNHAFQQTEMASRTKTINKINIIVTTFTWPLYVLTWGLGPDVYDVISGEQEQIIETLLSVLLKSVAGLYAFIVYSELDIQEFGNTLVETLQNYIV